MTDSEIRRLAEQYIDEVVEESGASLNFDEREAAIGRVEGASRELSVASRERGREPVPC